MAVGSEAMAESLQAYAYLQTATPKIPGIKPLADKMKERFKKKPKGGDTQLLLQIINKRSMF